MSTTTRLWLTHVHFRVLVFGTKQSETSISRCVSAPRLFSDICTSYCACVNSTSGILVFSLTTRSRMISYDVRAFDGFSLKAGPKRTNIFVSNEKALVPSNSRKGYMGKELLMYLSTKPEIFQGPLICVEAAWDQFGEFLCGYWGLRG